MGGFTIFRSLVAGLTLSQALRRRGYRLIPPYYMVNTPPFSPLPETFTDYQTPHVERKT